MKLTTPKDGSRNLFYVEGDSGEQYKVVWVPKYTRLFCQCDDFFIRQLPETTYSDGSAKSARCKHASFVQNAVFKAVLTHSAPVQLVSAEETSTGITIKTDRDPKQPEKPKYEVWCKGRCGSPFLSVSIPDVFTSREDAQRAIEIYGNQGAFLTSEDYEIRETR